MSNVKRVYVEKKSGFDVQAKELKTEIRSYLGIKDVDSVRVLIRYDVENVSDETFEKACNGIFSEPPVDTLYKEEFPAEEGSRIFSVEFLPGQFDQRADSAVQCIQFIKEDEQPVIRTATTYVIHGGEGSLSDEEFEAIKEHCINPVDSRESQGEKPEKLVTEIDEPADGESGPDEEKKEPEDRLIMQTGSLIKYLTEKKTEGIQAEKLAYIFHQKLADLITDGCRKIRKKTKCNCVALSGGVFQNRLLLRMVEEGLEKEHFTVLRHHLIPANDGGIALGQAAYAMQYIQEGK